MCDCFLSADAVGGCWLTCVIAFFQVTRLLVAGVIVWRPLCLHRLSSHSHVMVKFDAAAAVAALLPALKSAPVLAPASTALAKELMREINTALAKELMREIKQLEAYAAAIDASSSPPTIAVSLAALIWEPARAAAQLNTFLPQLQLPANSSSLSHASGKVQAHFDTRHSPVSRSLLHTLAWSVIYSRTAWSA